MHALLKAIIVDVIIKGLPKLVSSITDYIKSKKRESDREKSLKKYEQTGDTKDLLDLENKLNNK